MRLLRQQSMMFLAAAAMLAGCGVPREAARLAATEAGAVPATLPAQDADVRAALLAQDAAWQSLASLVTQREFGGISGVDSRFTELVQRAAAFSARQKALIAAGQDDPAQDRAALESFRALWQQTNRYLNP